MQPGIHDIPMAAYLADPCPKPSLSSSCGHRLITRSPLHAWQEHPKLGAAKQAEVSAANIGSVAHDMLMHGEGTVAVLDFPDWRTNASKEARAAARAKGKTPILAHELPAIKSMVQRALEFVANSEYAGIFDRGKPEQTIIWREGETWCRARPDWLTDDRDVMLHYKSTQASARAEPFIKGIMQSMGYGFALRFYARGLAAVVGHDKTEHLILVQEQEAPFACSLIGLSPAKAAIEDVRVALAIATWRTCVATDFWPGYDSRVHWADPTPWETAEAEAMAGETI
jgi:hypothetical protein